MTDYNKHTDNERLQPSMTRFFNKLPVDRPVVRNNWFFQAVAPLDATDPEELAWYTSVMGSEDAYEHVLSSYKREIGDSDANDSTQSAVSKEPLMQDSTNATNISPPSVDRLRLRSERQSLRRLPKTGAIVFTVRTYKTPITKLVREPGIAARLASALRGVQASAPETYK
jgi:hypothetical protein